MNLHALANPLVSVVNSNMTVILKKFTGITQNSFYEQVPSYTTSTVIMQVQALSTSSLSVANHLNLQGEMRDVISPVELRGVSRPDSLGGDLLSFDGHDWLVVNVGEIYPDHCKAIVQKQV